MLNGTFMAIYRNIMSPRVLVSFNDVIMENSGMTIIMTGMPSAVANIFCRIIFPLNLKRDRAYAAGAATMIIRVQETAV